MDYDALAQILPLAPQLWTTQHVQLWLQFVHLPTLSFAFSIHLTIKVRVALMELHFPLSMSSSWKD